MYGFTKAAEDGWAAGNTLTFFAIATVMLVGFVVVEARSANPLLPLRVVWDRNRGGSFLVSVLLGAGMLGMFLFMTYYFQGTLHYSPLSSGIAYLPFSGALIVTAIVASGLLPRVGPRNMMAVGGALATGAMIWLTQLRIDSSYASFILPALGHHGGRYGAGLRAAGQHRVDRASPTTTPASPARWSTPPSRSAPRSAWPCSTRCSPRRSPTTSWRTAQRCAPLGAVHGYNVAFTVSAVLLGAATVAAIALIRNDKKPVATQPEPEEDRELVGAGV